MRSILAALAALSLAACATPTGPAAYDAFDTYEGERVDLTGYEAVYVAPVTASEDVLARVDARVLGPQNRTRPIGADTLAEKQADLADELRESLGAVAAISEAPGPGVLTVQAELTALQANRPTMAEMSATPSLDFRSIAVGDAAARITLSEGDRVIGVIEEYALRRNLNDPTVGVATWGTADQFFRRVSDKVAALLR